MLSNWNIAEGLMIVSILINFCFLALSWIKWKHDETYHKDIKHILTDIDDVEHQILIN